MQNIFEHEFGPILVRAATITGQNMTVLTKLKYNVFHQNWTENIFWMKMLYLIYLNPRNGIKKTSTLHPEEQQ